ncbi:MAG: alpha/beta fold hydrolase [Candidatus Omnitrophota bacterium]|nr:alpha/beta fold hydrolase [Candidatus Omnitrophota bacterium]
MSTQFHLVNRGFTDALLLIPGWAADYRIFNSLDLDFNYLLPAPLSLHDFEDALTGSLRKAELSRISILGWSLGGFLAASFASNYPEYVKDVTFIGMRGGYDTTGLEKVKRLIRNNKTAYLYKFYNEWFSSGEEEKRSRILFKNTLAGDFLKESDTRELLDGLDYLGRARLDSAGLKDVKLKFIHGGDDRIAPIEEITDLKKGFPGAEFVIVKGAGHAPFLRRDFRKIFYGK